MALARQAVSYQPSAVSGREACVVRPQLILKEWKCVGAAISEATESLEAGKAEKKDVKNAKTKPLSH
jgi:hypothetical protein